MKKYHERLPRRCKPGRKCQFLSSAGERCKRDAVVEDAYFLDDEMYYGHGEDFSNWPSVESCVEHWQELHTGEKLPWQNPKRK